MRRSSPAVVLLTILTAVAAAAIPARAEGPDSSSDGPSVERGRYLVVIGNCNECHTEGWSETTGQTPEDQWLMGSGLGWRGPWGTTYGANLRITLGAFDEDDWVEIAREIEYRPPMPWWVLRAMSESDLRSIHMFVNQLGEPGDMAPNYRAPGDEPETPYVLFPSPPGE